MNRIREDEHVFVAGVTGGGKSELCKNYLAGFNRVIKLDTKGEALSDIRDKKNPWIQVPKKELVIVETLEDVMRADHPYIIYCPVFEELEFQAFNDFFQYVYFDKENTGTVTWVDEYMEVSDNPQRIPRYLKALLTKGRSRRTPVWTCTQRPSGISQIPFTQSTHFFVFDLPFVNDRKKMAESTQAQEMLQMPTGYNFWYFRRGWRNAVKGVLDL